MFNKLFTKEKEMSRVEKIFNIHLKFIGFGCPVQIEGTVEICNGNGDVDRRSLYFRSRYESWRLEIGDQIIGLGQYGDSVFEAGYMPLPMALRIVGETLCKWEGHRGVCVEKNYHTKSSWQRFWSFITYKFYIVKMKVLKNKKERNSTGPEANMFYFSKKMGH